MTEKQKAYLKRRLHTVVFNLSPVFIAGGVLLFIPAFIGWIGEEHADPLKLFLAYVLPGSLSLILGFLSHHVKTDYPLSLKDAMLVCTLSWIFLSLVAAVPFVFIIDASYLDGVFESMSGLTTTGITVFSGLDEMPRSILFWRALTQWIGGLGILSMFILIGRKGGAAANNLFLAESHKIAGKKPSPGMFNTVRILWTLYIGFTVAETALLMGLGLDLFDASTHALTTLSTGGFSIYDQSIAYYRLNGMANAHLIEMVIMLFMLAGGINFFLHFRVFTGDLKALWDSTEIRVFWGILFGFTALMILGHIKSFGLGYSFMGEMERTGLKALLHHGKDVGFQVISVITTTGYATRDVNSSYFVPLARQLFLILMVIGGCAGSTGGGFKVIRVAILGKLAGNQFYKMNTSRFTLAPLIIDGEEVKDDELKRIFAIFFLWILLLIVGGVITALFSNLDGWQSFSGMFSALGNIGPCYFSVGQMAGLHPVVKVTYILGMLAGRLEILPVFLIFGRKFLK